MLAKIKFLLHGGAVTSAELATATGANGQLNRVGLREVITSWRDSEMFEAKLETFLRLSLQQYEVRPSVYPYQPQFGPLRGGDPVRRDLITQNFENSYVRTAWRILASRSDFREVVTTRTWQVTTAMLAALVYADQEDFDGEQFRYFSHLNDADYSDWRNVTFVQAANDAVGTAFAQTAAFAASLRAIREGGTIVLKAPRVGFSNSPTFFANWGTNQDNQHRVTTNQTLIVALDSLFETGDTTQQPSLIGLAEDHAEPTTACYQCHRLMDPMRLQFQNVYTVGYRARAEPRTLAPSFAYQGYVDSPATMDAFTSTLVSHPRFPAAWVQKLCMWANTQRCDEEDPEFRRLAEYFTSGFDFLDLVVEVMSSPLITGAASTSSHTESPLFVSISRRNHLCSALEVRLGEARAERCAVERMADPQATPSSCTPNQEVDCERGLARSASELISSDTFGRGNRDFVQASLSDPFNTRALQDLCTEVGGEAIGGNGRTFGASDVPAALDRMAQYIMGLPVEHPRYQDTRATLQRLYDIAVMRPRCDESGRDVVVDNVDEVVCGLGLSAVRALHVPWLFACTSPELAGLGL